MKLSILAGGIVLAALSFSGNSAEAQGVHLGLGRLHIDVGDPHYRGHHGYHRVHRYGHGHWGGRHWHDTSHYDYYPGGYYRHGNHYDYVPGHYHFHRSGHWHHGY